MKHMNLKPVTTLILAILFLGSASVPALELSGRKVVIDPGHGGSDPGALGYNGSAWPDEADFNLTVSLKVRDLLQAAGCTVVMTRSTDVAVDLYVRRDIVNANNPDASLCIHCNSFSDPAAHGTETFWCSSNCNGDSGADQDLATKVQNRLIQFLGRTSRGVKQYNFVMCSPTPPSCLAEMLFVSNEAEFNLINSAGGQDSAAAAFFYAVCDRVGVVDPATPSSLSATAVSASQINLSWSDNSGLEDSYKVERATASGGPWSEIASVGAGTTSYSSSGLIGGTTYYYRVRAHDGQLGYSAYSGTASATTQGTGDPIYSATWGPYNVSANNGTGSGCQTIYYSANYNLGSLRTGWWTTTETPARCVFRAADAYMATMPASSLAASASFYIQFQSSGTYSTSATKNINVYKVNTAWTYGSSTTWAAGSPWSSAGGDYSDVGAPSQSVVYPADGTGYTWTWSGGANCHLPHGVMLKGAEETSTTYRTAWKIASPTLSVTYSVPPGTTNGIIRNWAYLGSYLQGGTAEADRTTRINTDYISGTYNSVLVDEVNVRPKATASYNSKSWAVGLSTNDLCDLNGYCFYNDGTYHEYGVTYCAAYVYNSGSALASYLGIGSDDSCKVWWNGSVVDSHIGGRGTAADSDFWGSVTINSGWNFLMIKVENGGTGHGVYARFANANRTALTGVSQLTVYTSDATAPGAPAGLAVAGVTSGVWQNTVSAPTFTWTSGADTQGSGEGVSGVRGQKYYFGTSGSATPDTFQTGVSFAPGAQADGTYYFKVDTVDYALNESGVAAFTFMYDGTAPDGVSGFGSASPGSSDTDWHNSAADLTWTWGAATDATSGLDGYAIAQDQVPGTEPGTTLTHEETVTSYTLAGPQTSGEYWLHVRSKDNAGNWQGAAGTAHRRIRIDSTAPTGVSMGFGAVTTESIEVTGAGTDAHSQVNASTGYIYSHSGGNSGATGTSHVWTGLTANTEYTGLLVTVSDQAVPTPNSAASAPQSQWTLSAPPGEFSVTPDTPTPSYGSTNVWTAVGGFGAGAVQYYRYVFDQSPTHVWADDEAQWSSGTLATVPGSAGTWYLHIKGYNGADVGNGAYDYALTVAPKTLTVTGIQAENKAYDGTTDATLNLGGAALVGVVAGDDVTLDTTAVAGAFDDANVGTGKAVTISGLGLTGDDAGSYTLSAPSATADITGAPTTTALASSENPSAPGSNVTFTATVTAGVGTPGGEVVFLANAVPFSTNALVGGVAAVDTAVLPLGTNLVVAEYAVQGNYLGSSDSLEQVVQSLVVCSQTNAIVGIADNQDGTFTLTFMGTPQAQYYVVGSGDVVAPMSSWAVLPGSTNTVSDPSGLWQITVTNTAAQQYYRSTAVVPCP